MKRGAIILPVLLSLAAILSASADPVVVGSKKFTESYVLGEIAKRSLENAGVSAEHRQGMGGTIILWQALSAGQIDCLSRIHRNNQRRDFEESRSDIA